jgi:PAS domain S-box-containing protein
MRELFTSLYLLLPHGFCYQWNQGLLWLHAISDTLIALAYFLIPIALIYFVRRRKDVPFGWMFVCFGVFIAACGATHAMDVWTLWVPSYWFSGGVKVITAMASVPTAIFLVRLMPTVLQLPSPEQMMAANDALNRQTAALKKTEERFRQMADNIQEIFWILDAQTKGVSYVSPAFEQICERSLDSLFSNPTSYRELIHVDDRDHVLAELEKLVSNNRFDEEFRIVCPSGTVKWIRAIGFTARNAAGKVETLVGTAQEITPRKIMEAVLRESEDRYRDLVEHSTDLISTYTLDGSLQSVNELPAKLLGYTPAELLKKPMRDFLLPEARAQFDQSLLDIQRHGFVKGSMVVLTKSGEQRIWEYHNTLRTEGVAEPVVRGIAHDITDKKRAEKELRRSEEKFSKAFGSSPVEMMITTLEEGRFLEVNESFERNIGYRREEVLGRTSLELDLWVNPADRAALVEEIKLNRRVVNREIRIRARSGDIGFKLYSAELILIGNDECLLAVSEDVTDRKRAEENLARSEAFLTEGQKLTRTGSWRWNPGSGDILLSRETFRIFGVDRLTTKPTRELFLHFIHPDDKARVKSGIERIAHEKSDFELDYRIVLSDGSQKYIHAVGRPVFTASGEFIEFIGTVMDVTERKRSEEELLRLSGQLLRLQDDERRKIARDLHDSTGQNLVALATMIAQLRASLAPIKPKTRRLVFECVALADRCLQEVRTLSYLLHPPVLDDAGLVDAIRDYVSGFTKRSGIRVKLELSPNIGRMSRNVELVLYRVLQESLTNVHRHSGSPQATIRLDRGSHLTLEVSDQGRGCSPATSRGEKEQVEAGVGIPSMQERVKLIGGRLDVDFSGQGTTVRVTIPPEGEQP